MNTPWYEKAIIAIPKVVKVINTATDTVITILRATIIFFLVPILALALFVEQQRIAHGIELFEQDSEQIAALGAWLLVLANLIFEIAINYIEQRANWQEPSPAIFSLRSWGNKLAYWIGFKPGRGQQWEEKLQSPAHKWKGVLGIITKTILFLAIIGSLKDEFQAYQDLAWHQAFLRILKDSNIETIGIIASGFLFALAVVRISQELTRYITIRAVEFSHELEVVIDEIDPERVEVLQEKTEEDEKRVVKVYAHFLKVTPEKNEPPVAMDGLNFETYEYWDPKYKRFQNGSKSIDELESALRGKIKRRS